MRAHAAGRVRRRLLAASVVCIAIVGCDRSRSSVAELVPPEPPSRIEPPMMSSEAGRANLVLISIDTLRADQLGVYGNDRPTSPHIDRFADDSVVFENAFSQSPKTAASHMTLMTGLYPDAHRVRNRMNGAEGWSGSLSADIPTLAEFVAASGYRTGAFTGGGNVQGDLGFARGFESYSDPVEGDPKTFHKAAKRLVQWSRDDQPFFLFVHSYQTHSPYLPPRRYRDRFIDPEYSGKITSKWSELASGPEGVSQIHREFWSRVDPQSEADRRHLLDLYDACIRFVDDEVGELLERIDALGLRDNTVVVLLSDHGEEFGEHGEFEHNALWQELLHVPLIIRVPAGVRPGWGPKRISESVGLIDVLPTLLELLGIAPPGHLQGDSLAPLVESGAPVRAWLFAQYRLYDQMALQAGDFKLLRRGPYQQVFDLSSDPAELHDAGQAHPEWLAGGAAQVEHILEASRAYWKLVRDGETTELDAEQRRHLEALGYAEDP